MRYCALIWSSFRAGSSSAPLMDAYEQLYCIRKTIRNFPRRLHVLQKPWFVSVRKKETEGATTDFSCPS